jgi:hypothetical protein
MSMYVPAKGWNEIRNGLFQIVNGHVLELNLLGSIDVSSIGENAE